VLRPKTLINSEQYLLWGAKGLIHWVIFVPARSLLARNLICWVICAGKYFLGGEIFNLLKDIRTGGHREVVRHDGNELSWARWLKEACPSRVLLLDAHVWGFYLLNSEVEQTCLDYFWYDSRVITMFCSLEEWSRTQDCWGSSPMKPRAGFRYMFRDWNDSENGSRWFLMTVFMLDDLIDSWWIMQIFRDCFCVSRFDWFMMNHAKFPWLPLCWMIWERCTMSWVIVRFDAELELTR